MKSTIDPFNAHHLAVKRPLSFSVTNGGMAKKYKSSEQNGVTDEDPLNIQPISEQLPAEESVSSIIGGLLSEVCCCQILDSYNCYLLPCVTMTGGTCEEPIATVRCFTVLTNSCVCQ